MYYSDEINNSVPYATPDELAYLRLCTNAKLIVMLGAGPGVLLLAALEGSPNAKSYVVDIDTVHYTLAHCQAAGYAPVGIVGDTKGTLTINLIPNNIDILIIDADHTYEGVKADILNYLPKVAAGGLIMFHDYDATGTQFAHMEQYPGVMKAVTELIQWPPIARPGTSVVFRNAT